MDIGDIITGTFVNGERLRCLIIPKRDGIDIQDFGVSHRVVLLQDGTHPTLKTGRSFFIRDDGGWIASESAHLRIMEASAPLSYRDRTKREEYIKLLWSV